MQIQSIIDAAQAGLEECRRHPDPWQCVLSYAKDLMSVHGWSEADALLAYREMTDALVNSELGDP